MEKQKIYYMVCSSPRSGSSLLCNLLENTGIAGKKNFENVNAALLSENWKTGGDLKDFFKELFYVSETDNGVSGFKVHWIHMENLAVKNHQVLSNKDLAKLLPTGLKYIFITRRDVIKQAVSLEKAKQTHIFRETKNKSGIEKDFKAEFCFFKIERYISIINYFNKGWEKYFKDNNIKPLEIVYEDLTKDFRGNIVKTLEYLGVDVPNDLNIKTDLIKQSNDINDKWILEYNNSSVFKKIFFAKTFKFLGEMYGIFYKLRQSSVLYRKFFDFMRIKIQLLSSFKRNNGTRKNMRRDAGI